MKNKYDRVEFIDLFDKKRYLKDRDIRKENEKYFAEVDYANCEVDEVIEQHNATELNLKVSNKIIKSFEEALKVHVIDISYGDSYFVGTIGNGKGSVVHFKVKENKRWLFGIWINRIHTVDKEDLEIDVFVQYEKDIDKFKPSRSSISKHFEICAHDFDTYQFDEYDFDAFSILFKHKYIGYEVGTGVNMNVNYLSPTQCFIKYIHDELSNYIYKVKKQLGDKYCLNKTIKLLNKLGKKYSCKFILRDKCNEDFSCFPRYSFRKVIFCENIYKNKNVKKYIKIQNEEAVIDLYSVLDEMVEEFHKGFDNIYKNHSGYDNKIDEYILETNVYYTSESNIYPLCSDVQNDNDIKENMEDVK